MPKTDKILIGPQPNVTHNPTRPRAGKQMFHPCSTITMNISIHLLLDSQCLAANERDMGMQASLICTIMYTTSNSMKHPLVRCGPYLSHILTLALIPGKTGRTHTMLPKLSTATATFHKIAYFLHSARTAHVSP